jgi:hypothetical protein
MAEKYRVASLPPSGDEVWPACAFRVSREPATFSEMSEAG